MMKVLIAGATGLIGKELVKQCTNAGIEIHYLTTSKDKIKNESNIRGFYWNPATQEIDTAAFDGVHAIVNLAGASVSERWTESYKKQILESRIATASLLKQTLQAINHNVVHYISASGISAYPSSFDATYDESYEGYADSFLGKVTAQWEQAAKTFTELGIKVAMVRTGIVLDGNDGALPKIVKPVRMGVGASLGTGKQYQSWIHIHDIAGIYLLLLKSKLEGVYNGVAPGPITNKEMTVSIGRYLSKPLWLPHVPAFMLKLILGEMGALVLESQNVSSKKIAAAGYEFRFTNFEDTLDNLLS